MFYVKLVIKTMKIRGYKMVTISLRPELLYTPCHDILGMGVCLELY